MLKLILDVALPLGTEAEVTEISRKMVWPVLPRIGEDFYVGVETAFTFRVEDVVHYPPGGCFIIKFVTHNPHDLTGILKNEKGWVSGDEDTETLNKGWPTIPRDHNPIYQSGFTTM